MSKLTNLKAEIIEDFALANHYKLKDIAWAKIIYKPTYAYDEQIEYILSPNSTADTKTSFINSLNFEYCNNFGTQYIFGIIMMNDGS